MACPGCRTPNLLAATGVIPVAPPIAVQVQSPNPSPLDFTEEKSQQKPQAVLCPYCESPITTTATKCRHCGEFLKVPDKSNAIAGTLGCLFGPVGLWYKGHWAAGFAWLVMGFVLCIALTPIVAPLLWIGMTVHAAVATPKR